MMTMAHATESHTNLTVTPILETETVEGVREWLRALWTLDLLWHMYDSPTHRRTV